MIRNNTQGLNLTELSFNSDNEKQIEWENDNEFSYKGAMYDVIEKKYEDGKLIIRCIDDNKETELTRKYQDIAGNDFGNSPKTKAILLKLINSLYTMSQSDALACVTFPASLSFPEYKFRIPITICGIITPPPRCW